MEPPEVILARLEHRTAVLKLATARLERRTAALKLRTAQVGLFAVALSAVAGVGGMLVALL